MTVAEFLSRKKKEWAWEDKAMRNAGLPAGMIMSAVLPIQDKGVKWKSNQRRLPVTFTS